MAFSNYNSLIIILLVFFLSSANAQDEKEEFITPSQLGFSGLIYTPTAYIGKWPTINVGFTHFTKRASLTYEGGTSPERSFFANITFLPNVELSLNVTRPYSNIVQDSIYGGIYYGIGDRSISLRVKVLKEKQNRPAILIGIQDPSANLAFFNTNYIVLSKKKKINNIQVNTHIGYGIKLEKTRNEFLQGPFGGIQATWKSISGLAEYDTERFNIGASYQFRNLCFIKIAMINARHFTGNISLRFKLKP